MISPLPWGPPPPLRGEPGQSTRRPLERMGDRGRGAAPLCYDRSSDWAMACDYFMRLLGGAGG